MRRSTRTTRRPARRRLSLLSLLTTAASIFSVASAAPPPPCAAQPFLYQLVTLCICAPCKLCHFDWIFFQCRPLYTPPPDVPPAVDTPFEQPALAPEDWFLSEDELTASRGGVARSDLAVWTDGNAVDVFTTTDGFFASVYRDVEAASGPGQIFVSGWEVTNVPFQPQSPQYEHSRFQAVMGRALDRGMDLNVLIWTNPFHPHQMAVLQSWANAHARGAWLFDNRLPYLTSSHHQKTIVIKSPTQEMAYVGGIDLTGDRWDTLFHNNAILRRLHDIARNYDGWIDASLKLRGPAVRDVAANFVARWNDPRKALAGAVPFSNPVLSTRKAKLESFVLTSSHTNNATAAVGTMSVQLTRTYSCKEGSDGYPFAPQGEVSILHARLKAIRQAVNYVYVEDQYFIHVPLLLDALLDVLPRIKALVVVTQELPMLTSATGYEVLLFRMLQPLVDQFPSKVFVFTPRKHLKLYVHTKVVIVDDVFLSVGSANWNRRSMTSDSEVTANVVDRKVLAHTPDGVQVAALARAFRVRKFSEFSGIAETELARMRFLEALYAMRDAATNKTNGSLVEPLTVDAALYFNVYPSGFEDEIDAEDLCG